MPQQREVKRTNKRRDQATEEQHRDQATEEQLIIWDAIVNSSKHLLIEAYAGSGKTSTGVAGLSEIQTNGPAWLGSDRPITAQFTAFNKSVQLELADKVAPFSAWCEARTMHSFGYYIMRELWGISRDNNRFHRIGGGGQKAQQRRFGSGKNRYSSGREGLYQN